jgi:hypothetical protein
MWTLAQCSAPRIENLMDESMLRRAAVLLLGVSQLLAPLWLFPGTFNEQTAKPPLAAVPNPATPAGYAFAIWGVIYLGALAFAVYQALPSNANDPLLERIGWLTAAGYALCIAWLLAARFGPVWATVPIILGMLCCLGAAFAIVMQRREALGVLQHAVVAAPLALYVGWLSAASFVNAADVLPGYGFARFGMSAQSFGVLVIGCAALLACAVTLRTAAYPAYVVAVLWALTAIVARNGLPAPGNPVSIAATVAALILLGLACGLWWTGSSGRSSA